MTSAERLLKAADLLDKRAAEASPGPWYYNGYSYVGSGAKSAKYYEWENGIDGHTLEREGLCEPCGSWRGPIDCLPNWKWPRGHGCRLFDEDYDLDPEVVRVRSHHGDTAVRSRAADAEWIATMHPDVGKAISAVLRDAADAIATGEPGYAETLALADLLLAGAA